MKSEKIKNKWNWESLLEQSVGFTVYPQSNFSCSENMIGK